jgi:hypothetical protein
VPTIAYYVVFKPDEKELESLNRLGDHSRAQGYRFHEGKWYRRIGMMPASDACAKEAKDRPLTMEEIKSWVE